MPDFHHFQRRFAARLAEPAAAPQPLDVHRNTVLLGLVEALGDNFPVVRALIGEEAFVALAVAHAAASPPDTPVLAHYGQDFPAWLARHPLAAELPYLADVAACERLWVEALHAADAPALDLDALREVPIESLLGAPLPLHPAARFAWQETPAMAIWLAHQDGPPTALAPEWQPCGALFTRPVLSVAGGAIDAAAYQLLRGLGEGACLEQAAAAVTALHPQTDIGSCFAGLIQRGAFAALPPERSQP